MTKLERAVLAGVASGHAGPIRKLPGIVNTCRIHGRRCTNATYRNHSYHAEAIEIEVRPGTHQLSRPFGVLLPDPRSDHFKSPRQRYRNFGTPRKFSMSPRRSVTRHSGQSTMSTPPACGLAAL